MSTSASTIANSTSPTNAVIGKTVVINGEVQSREPLTVYGQVVGTIEVGEHVLTVAAGADVRARINARGIDVQGRVEGKVEAAETVIIRGNGEFIGDIHASSLIIDEGGYIKGNIDLTKPLRDTPFERGTSPSENTKRVEHALVSA